MGTSAAIVEGAKAVPRDGAGSILFASDRRATTGGFNIYRMDADGRGPMRRLTEAPGDRVMPAVSPDGEKIAFASDSSGDGEIWRMRADGTDPTKLTHSPNSEDLQPAWQPLP